MSCYNPQFMAIDFTKPPDSFSGKRPYKFMGPYTQQTMKLYDPTTIVKIPCGKCLGCKLDYSRHWADRMILEYAGSGRKAIFVTLTYNELHYDKLPEEGQLCKSHLQLFFKRLRNDYPFGTIRYFACGEYGKKYGRPHYHAIIFGLSLEDFDDKKVYKTNKLGQVLYISEKFNSKWSDEDGPIGYAILADVSYKACAYVARYTAKKVYGHSVPGKTVEEFALMSRRPGIGSPFIKAYCGSDDPDISFFDRRHFYLSDSNGSVEVSFPPYFLKKFKVDYPVEYDMMMSLRRDFGRDKELLKLQQSNLSFEDQLKVDYEKFINKTEILFNREEDF